MSARPPGTDRRPPPGTAERPAPSAPPGTTTRLSRTERRRGYRIVYDRPSQPPDITRQLRGALIRRVGTPAPSSAPATVDIRGTGAINPGIGNGIRGVIWGFVWLGVLFYLISNPTVFPKLVHLIMSPVQGVMNVAHGGTTHAIGGST